MDLQERFQRQFTLRMCVKKKEMIPCRVHSSVFLCERKVSCEQLYAFKFNVQPLDHNLASLTV